MMVVQYGFILLVAFNKPLPAPDPPTRERFMTVVRDEIATMSRNRTGRHRIEPAQLQGQPTIATVLPAFHAFALDTVLVAHVLACPSSTAILRSVTPSSRPRSSSRCCRCCTRKASRRWRRRWPRRATLIGRG